MCIIAIASVAAPGGDRSGSEADAALREPEPGETVVPAGFEQRRHDAAAVCTERGNGCAGPPPPERAPAHSIGRRRANALTWPQRACFAGSPSGRHDRQPFTMANPGSAENWSELVCGFRRGAHRAWQNQAGPQPAPEAPRARRRRLWDRMGQIGTDAAPG